MNERMKRLLPACALAALLPVVAAAQIYVGGPKPIPRPDGPYSISGKIVNGMTGAPVPGAEVAISTGAQGVGPVFEIAESGGDGGFRFNHLPEGKYTLKAERRGYAPQALLQHENYWSGVAVGPGNDALHVRFPIYPSAVITGQVMDENGEGLRQATVKLWKRSFDNGKLSVEMQEQAATDDRGIYRFDHLPAGKYAVSVHARPWYAAGAGGQSLRRTVFESDMSLDEEQPESMDLPQLGAEAAALPDVVYPPVYYPRGNDLAAASWFELQPGEEESADFQLAPIPGIRLLVRYNSGSREEGSALELSEMQGDGEEGGSPSVEGKEISPGLVEFIGLTPGRFKINLPVGEDGERQSEDLDLGADSEFDFRQSTSSNFKWSAEVQFSGDLGRNPWGALELRDETGRTFDASIRLLPLPTVATDGPQDKSIQFHPIPPAKGVYDVEFRVPVGGTIESIEATGATVSGHRITTQGGDVHLKIKASVSQISLLGTAKKNGEPFAGAMMLLLPENGGPQQVRRDQSDSDGTFALANVVPGRYKLLALEHGWEMPWADPEQQKALLAKGMAIEIGKVALAPVTVEVQ